MILLLLLLLPGSGFGTLRGVLITGEGFEAGFGTAPGPEIGAWTTDRTAVEVEEEAVMVVVFGKEGITIRG